MNIDCMTPDELRRACRDLLRENETLRRRLADEPVASPFASLVSHLLDGLSTPERDLVGSLAGSLR